MIDDLSSSGLSILVKEELEKEDSIDVKLELYLERNGTKVLHLKAKVMRVAPMDWSKIEYKEDYCGIDDILQYKYFLGVQFESLKEEDRRTIEKYIAIVTKSIDKMTYYI